MSDHEEGESHAYLVPHWMVTFSDMRVVLLCFFVLLVGFSGKGTEESDTPPPPLSGGRGVFGHDEPETKNAFVPPMGSSASSAESNGNDSSSEHDSASNPARRADLSVSTAAVANALPFEQTERGFEVRILCGTLFARGSAAIMPAAERTLATVAEACHNQPHLFRVQAATDEPFAPSAHFPSEESLALQRAAAVCAYLHDRGRTPMAQVAVSAPVARGAGASDRVSQVVITVQRATKKGSP